MNSTEPLDRDATAGTRYPRDPNRQPGAGVRAGLGELGGRVEVAVCPRADAVIALTAGLAKRLRDDRVDGGEIHIIPPGVNSTELAQPAAFSRTLRQARSAPER